MLGCGVLGFLESRPRRGQVEAVVGDRCVGTCVLVRPPSTPLSPPFLCSPLLTNVFFGSLQYENRKAEYFGAIWDVLNWKAAEKRFAA